MKRMQVEGTGFAEPKVQKAVGQIESSENSLVCWNVEC